MLTLIPYYVYKKGEKMENLHLYRITEEYSRYIYEENNKVMKNFATKRRRPYIGIVLEINNINYFAPMSSPKEKHKLMKNNIDFIKINDGRDGIINLNNMIPVPLLCCEKIDINQEIKQNKKYGLILKYQYIWCNKNYILNKANKLYNLIILNKANMKLKNRCCDFKCLEEKYKKF